MAQQPADFEAYQTAAAVDQLYYVKNSGRGTEREDSIIEVTGGTVNIFGSLRKPTTPTTDMSLDRTAFSGIDTFASVPTWIYFEDDTGTPVVTLSSITIEEAT